MNTDVHARARRARIGGRGGRAALAVALCAAGFLASACEGPRAVATGEQARAFSLPPLANSGHDISLSNYAGRPVIIVFFATWSPTSAAEVRLLGHFYRARHGRVLIVGVDARDSADAARQLLRKMRVTYPVAADGSLAVASRFHVPGVPAAYFLDARHKIVETQLGGLNWAKIKQGVTAMRTSTVIRHPNGD
jgi:cytochrome c biogenesis protein CcmG/thiol:disulfide interchange protein DsbE